jgi:hypothetical protein
LIDDPAQRDERTFKRLVRALPVAGDLIDLDEETVIVTRVSLSSQRYGERRRAVLEHPPSGDAMCSRYRAVLEGLLV